MDSNIEILYILNTYTYKGSGGQVDKGWACDWRWLDGRWDKPTGWYWKRKRPKVVARRVPRPEKGQRDYDWNQEGARDCDQDGQTRRRRRTTTTTTFHWHHYGAQSPGFSHGMATDPHACAALCCVLYMHGVDELNAEVQFPLLGLIKYVFFF